MSVYPYSPLNLPLETRILTVYPGSEDDDIECSLSHIPISSDTDEESKYEALSYCWSRCTDREPPTPTTTMPFVVYYSEGKPANNFFEQFQQFLFIPGYKSLYYRLGGCAPEGTIICDKIPILVGGELHAAVKQLRSFHKDEKFKIWIDAVCINQDDVMERNEHVKIMSKIYGGASIVRIWLGEEFGKEATGVHALKEVNIILDYVLNEQDLGGNRFEIQKAFLNHEKTKAIDWDAVSSILSRSWFRRVWVLQEVANAKEASIHIGEFVLDWEYFSRTISLLLQYALDESMGESVIEIQNLSTMVWLRDKLGHFNKRKTRLRLLEVLGETKAFKSTHAVDKIYGLLSLFPNAVRDVEIDYSGSAEDIFTKFAIKQLNKRRNLDILNHCTPPTEPRGLNLPSWVPDWTQTNYTEPFYLRGLESNAAGKTKPKFIVDPDSTTLRIFGKLVDRIAHLEKLRIIPSRSKYWKPKSLLDGTLQTPAKIREGRLTKWADADRDWHGAVVRMVTKNLSKPIPAELWRVFMCNRTRENEVPDERCGLGFRICLTAKFWGESPSEALKRNKEMGDVPDGEEVDKALSEFEGAFAKWCYNRRFFETERGLFGWAMDGVQEGDELCVFYGGKYPFVISSVEDGKYRIVGDCYIHGFMDGEALSEDFEEKELLII